MQSLCEKYFGMVKTANMPCAMTVAGSDSGAGAGIQADILAIAANGVYACSVVTALTAHDPDGVYGVLPAGAESVEAQMKAVADFYSPGAAKTGMLFDAQTVAAVAKFFRANRGIKLVVDPVAISTSGAKLLSDDAVGELKNSLIPISDVFTPNIDEAKMLLGADSIDDTTDAAEALYKKFSIPVLLKGGHLEGGTVSDVFFDGVRPIAMDSRRIEGVNTHGSGCTLSAAIAANLAKGLPLADACRRAKEYLVDGISRPVRVGGQNFINHLPGYSK